MKADLHLHSTASDGTLTPAELVARAASLGLEAIAITDHDSVAGIPPALEAAREFPGLLVIPGVEINTDVSNSEAHVLGYFIDWTDRGLQDTLCSLRGSRLERGRRMVRKLAGLGVDIDWERVLELAGGASMGRPHLAQAILERGYVSSISEAFTRYIGRHGPAYAERTKLTPLEAARLVLRAGGLPVLGHPADIPELERFVQQLKAEGLAGIEAYYGYYSVQTMERLVRLAGIHGLLTTGGSDFHGLDEAREPPIGGLELPADAVGQLSSMAEQKRLVPE
ncbi:PHP domain-containing protein [Chloroflexota bacterium]